MLKVYFITQDMQNNNIPLPGDLDGKESTFNAGDPDLIPGLGRSLGEGNGKPLQYSCLEHPMDRGARQAGYSPWGQKELDSTEWQTLSLSLLLTIFIWPPFLLLLLLQCGHKYSHVYLYVGISVGLFPRQKYLLFKERRNGLEWPQSQAAVTTYIAELDGIQSLVCLSKSWSHLLPPALLLALGTLSDIMVNCCKNLKKGLQWQPTRLTVTANI